MTFKSMLADYLRDQAGWRDLKADEYPEDARNARCADALRRLADYVEALPATDSNLAALAAIHEPYGLDLFAPGEEGRQMVSRFGFDREESEEGFAIFLAQLVEAEISDTVEREHEDA